MQLGLSESARATTAEEARFRINYPNSRPRKSRVIALDKTAEELRKLGIEVHFITPADYRTVPMPGYSEIGLSLTTRGPVVRRVEELRPEAIHIAT